MTDEQMNGYKMRISQAGVGELTVVMLEMEMQWIEEALSAYDRQDLDVFTDVLGRAQAVQVELMNVLNRENSVAADVYAVFAFINKQLILARIKRQPLEIKRCRDMLEQYHESFRAIAKTDTAGPVIEGSEKVYAGLTYGVGGLVESSTGGMDFQA
ncbi:MAG: flagellar protein FliS [Bacteroidales bacterium]|nr:flagellar protein FliS [Clostridium sp.]MCM1203806.1 flagellar protein FliS [Bacteroidales bacterium]